MNGERERNDLGSSFILPRSSLVAGLELFNAQKFWHAHEAWERDWLHAEGDLKVFLQGLIQLAAAYHHVQRGTFRGGVRLFDAALSKLATFPVHFFGIDRAEVVACAEKHRASVAKGEHIDGGELPKFRYN
jgi:predicted metal-dependent hydrolase